MTSPSYTIRAELPGDEPAIRIVHQNAFPTDTERRLVDALRAAGRLKISLVGVAGDQIVAHIAFSPVAISNQLGGLGLAPVAVLPSFQKRGIGAALIRQGLDACRDTEAGFVVVLGEPRYYARFGFVSASHWRLADEYGGGDAFQAIELQPGAIPPNGGQVRYSQEFSIFAA